MTITDTTLIRLVPLGSGPDPFEEQYRKDCEYLEKHPGATWAIMGSARMGAHVIRLRVERLLNGITTDELSGA